ncbi:MAG: protein kinase domain-containing protein [Fimbriiglobus sp.]
MADSSADRDPLDRLAEEFVARFRGGERPSLEEYAARLPGREEEVRDLFPALVEMEQLKPVTADQTGAYSPVVEPSDPVRLGDFRIIRRIGAGGMGVVFEAIQESLGRHVALKLLPAEALLDPKKLERFRREAKSAAKLHHTNVVPVYGTGEANGRHFYAMQFIAGHPIDAVIDELKRLKGQAAEPLTPPEAQPATAVASALLTGTFDAAKLASAPDPIPARTQPHSPAGTPSGLAEASHPSSLSAGGSSYWATVARLMAQVADGLDYAHKQGVLHRDIKPANLLLDLSGTVWITDFGLAKSNDADDLTNTGDVLGTLRYMAPERFEGQGDGRADIYALGLTLYELLTLTPAFHVSNRAKLVEQVIAANPPRPRSINSSIPRDLETVVLKAIARDPAMRYQTAGAMADDLQRYLEDRPITARRASSAEQAFRWCRRNPAVASLLTAVLLVFAVGAGVSSHFAVRASDRAADANVARADALVREQEAVAAQQAASAARAAAETLAGEKQRQVIRLHLAASRFHLDNKERDAGLLWAERAWREDTTRVFPEANHRLRLGIQLSGQIPLVGLAAHDAPLSDARIDTEGRTALTLTRTGKAFIWDMRNGSMTVQLQHPAAVTSVALSADGKWAITGSADGTARIWDTVTSRVEHTLAHGDPVEWVDISASGGKIAIAGGKVGATVWDRATGSKTEQQPQVPDAYYAIFSPDGTRLATADSGGNARVWDVVTGKPLTATLPQSPRNQIERNWNYRLGPIFSPDGSRLLTAGSGKVQYSGGSQTDKFDLTLWDIATAKAVWGPVSSGAHFARFDPTGKMLLTGGNSCFLLDAETGKQLYSLRSIRHCQRAEFTDDGGVAVISTGGLLQLFKLPKNKSPQPVSVEIVPNVATLTNSARAADTMITASTVGDGRYLFAAGWDGTARLYDLVPPTIPDYAYDCGNADCVTLITESGVRRRFSGDGVWECQIDKAGTATVGPRADFSHPKTLPVGEPVIGVDLARIGRLLVTGTSTSLRAWNATDGTPVGPPIPHGINGEFGFVLSGDGGRAVIYPIKPVAPAAAEVTVFDLVRGEKLLTCRYEPSQGSHTSNQPTLSIDGRRLATGDFQFSSVVEVWDVDARQRLCQLNASRGHLMHLEFTPDATRVLVSSSDSTSRLWDVETRQAAGPPLPVAARGRRIAPDGRKVVTFSLSRPGFMEVYDALTGELFGTAPGFSSTMWFDRDSSRVLMGFSGKVAPILLKRLTLHREHIGPLCELTTGKRLDRTTDGIEFLPVDVFTRDPERCLSAFRLWKAEQQLKSK